MKMKSLFFLILAAVSSGAAHAGYYCSLYHPPRLPAVTHDWPVASAQFRSQEDADGRTLTKSSDGRFSMSIEFNRASSARAMALEIQVFDRNQIVSRQWPNERNPKFYFPTVGVLNASETLKLSDGTLLILECRH